jgi:hypothetical protein
MWNASLQLRHYCKRNWGAVAGISTGVFLIALQLSSPHVGDSCGRLGQVAQEWRIGFPARQIMCVATTEGDLVYDRPIMPRRTKDAAANQF